MKLYKVNWRLFLAGEHCFLNPTDECYFTGVYECPHRSLKPLIIGVKHGRRAAIEAAAQNLRPVIPSNWQQQSTFVPMPSAGARNFLAEVVQRLGVADYRDLLFHTRSTLPSHKGWCLTPSQRLGLMAIDELATDPRPKTVIVVDDVLTTGAHFRAAKVVIQHRWPEISTIGLFLARTCLRRRECAAAAVHGQSSPADCRWNPITE